MAITTRKPPHLSIWTPGYKAAADLSSYQYCVVVPSASASADMEVAVATAQGEYAVGVLQNTPASGAWAEVMVIGTSDVIAAETINSGVEVTIQAAGGKIEAAASGDWVIGRSLEAAVEADQRIAVDIFPGYWKP